MAEKTGISWTDHTFNPWWGCHKVSPACKHCYAADWAGRFGYAWGKSAPRRFFGAKHWREPLAWNTKAQRLGTPAFVFSASMSDVFEERDGISDETWAEMQDARARLWDLVEATPWLVWLLLSKRPGLAPDFVPRAWMTGSWPSNCWAGATMESQAEAERRCPDLLRLPAPRHFASYEPAQEAVDFTNIGGKNALAWQMNGLTPTRLDWVIYGGESGDHARPSDVAWGRSMIRQSRAAGAAPWFKQTGCRGYDSDAPGSVVDGEARIMAAGAKLGRNAIMSTPGLIRTLSTPHGSALVDLPEDCRVQERPAPLPVRAIPAEACA